MIRSILFDLGNVLVPFEIDRGYAALSANGGLPVDEIAVRIRESGLYSAFESGELQTTEFHECFSRLLDLKATPAKFRESGLYAAFESGEFETTEFHERFSRLLDLKATPAKFREIWNSIFLPDGLTSEELILELKDRYRLVLLSNTNELHFGWLSERYPVLRHFDAYTLSYEVGAMKPSPKIYEAAVANAKCAPEECFFTDDVLAYVEGARAYGIDAEQFQGEAVLRGHLQQRGLLSR